ncbi:MAG TPA: M56 family metallopeptidase [Ferruginibacter sp.]|nr:M56 family metallopeptidase [Ferruginibacter sp.]HMP22258.1 M56 family metallopeptidase [Ferruginibacter sp.]
MLLTVFEHVNFLLATGWAVLNSFWQAGAVWLLYKLLNVSSKQSTLLKYNTGLLFHFTTFLWFLCTLVQNYLLLSNSSFHHGSFLLPAGSSLLKQLQVTLPYIAVLYLLLLTVHLIRFIKKYYNTRLLNTVNWQKAPAELRLFTSLTAAQLGIKKKVQIWLSTAVEVPSLTGIVKPVILLPVAAISNLTPRQVESIILHELAHIKRNDFLINLILSLAETVLFFNPFIQMLGKALRTERENCCDDWVVNYQYNRYDYAAALLTLEQQRQQQHVFAMAATGPKNSLLKRVQRLFDNREPQTQTDSLHKTALAGLSILCGILMFSTVPQMSNNNTSMPVSVTDMIRPGLLYPPVAVAQPGIELYPTATALQNNALTIDALPNNTASKKPKNPPKNTNAEIPRTYTVALISSELLTEKNAVTATPTTVAEKDNNSNDLLVKVVEETSGQSQKNSYYFEVNNETGTPEVKPLVLLNTFNKNDSIKGHATEKNKKAPVKKKLKHKEAI